MKGLELCEKYFREVGYPALKDCFPELLPEITVGLVGQGSECLGFDDAYSRDHDWGPSFAMWLPEKLYKIENHQNSQANAQQQNHRKPRERRKVRRLNVRR